MTRKNVAGRDAIQCDRCGREYEAAGQARLEGFVGRAEGGQTLEICPDCVQTDQSPPLIVTPDEPGGVDPDDDAEGSDRPKARRR